MPYYHHSLMRLFSKLLFCLLLGLNNLPVVSAPSQIATTPPNNRSTQSIMLSADLDFTYERFNPRDDSTPVDAAQNIMVIWFTPGFNNQQRHYEFANRLSQQGVEVWVVDLLDNLFMPRGVNSIRQLSGEYVRDFILQAQQITHKKVVLISESYGAIPLLRGVYLWQHSNPSDTSVLGAVLFSPTLYEEIPPLGELPRYVPIAQLTSIPIMLYQSDKHSARRQLPELLSHLQQGGAAVFTKILNGATAIFYSADTAAATKKYLLTLPNQVAQSFHLLASIPPAVIKPQTQAVVLGTKKNAIGLNSALMPYTATTTPAEIHLKDVFGKTYNRDNYLGKLTIVNFWASWCVPCLEEIPSLNRLQQLFPDRNNFEILSINYAQSPAVIQQFMKKVHIDFPVLVDESGLQAEIWKVLVFPSTFVIGGDGKFHYGVNAGIMWDTQEVIETLKQLQQQTVLKRD